MKTGILLTNLGTPTEPTTEAVREYLAEFLSDKRVVNLPRWLWLPLLHGIILLVRPKRSAAQYQQIWLEQGAPLLHYTQLQADLLQQQLPNEFSVSVGMRYGKPSITHALEKLQQEKIDQLIVLPLYPQFSFTTTASTKDAIEDFYKNMTAKPTIKFIDHYFDHPLYIEALAMQIQNHWQQHGKAEVLLLSFHGLPKRNIAQGDPYADHCHATAEALARKLNLTTTEWRIVFQSRFGYAKWLEPTFDQTLKNLIIEKKYSVDVFCPGFPADCLETLFEVNHEYRKLFLQLGGREFNYIPALNDAIGQIELLRELVR